MTFCKKCKENLRSSLIAHTPTCCACFVAIEDHPHLKIPPWDDDYPDPDYALRALPVSFEAYYVIKVIQVLKEEVISLARKSFYKLMRKEKSLWSGLIKAKLVLVMGFT